MIQAAIEVFGEASAYALVIVTVVLLANRRPS